MCEIVISSLPISDILRLSEIVDKQDNTNSDCVYYSNQNLHHKKIVYNIVTFPIKNIGLALKCQ